LARSSEDSQAFKGGFEAGQKSWTGGMEKYGGKAVHETKSYYTKGSRKDRSEHGRSARVVKKRNEDRK